MQMDICICVLFSSFFFFILYCILFYIICVDICICVCAYNVMLVDVFRFLLMYLVVSFRVTNSQTRECPLLSFLTNIL